MRVTFVTAAGEMKEFNNVADVECREMNGEWVLKIDDCIEYVGAVPPDHRVQTEE